MPISRVMTRWTMRKVRTNAKIDFLQPNRLEHNGGEEVSGGLVVTGGDAAAVLEFVEKALDQIALEVDRRRYLKR